MSKLNSNNGAKALIQILLCVATSTSHFYFTYKAFFGFGGKPPLPNSWSDLLSKPLTKCWCSHPPGRQQQRSWQCHQKLPRTPRAASRVFRHGVKKLGPTFPGKHHGRNPLQSLCENVVSVSTCTWKPRKQILVPSLVEQNSHSELLFKPAEVSCEWLAGCNLSFLGPQANQIVACVQACCKAFLPRLFLGLMQGDPFFVILHLWV